MRKRNYFSFMRRFLTIFTALLIVSPLLTTLFANGNNRMKVGTVLSTQQEGKRTVTGTVVDVADDSPLVGATVMVKGNDLSTVITDINGHYSIQVQKSSDIIVVNYLGYKTREVPVEDLAILNIRMESSDHMLDEVVITGAGTQKKVSVTGSISTIKGSELKSPSSSLTNALAGRVAGIISTSSSGQPGASSQFYIRGISTFGGRATPLILLDDVEISVGDLNNIPYETIESFSILKDASATAIYGARGANGVMLVTTKRGQENTRTSINVSVENTFNQLTKFPEFTDGATWMEMYNEALTARNSSASPRYTQEDIDYTRSGHDPYAYPDVDWGSLIFKDLATSQKASINISGGGAKATYFMSVKATHDTGHLDPPKLYSFKNNISNWSYNFQNNISYKLFSNSKVHLNMNAQIRNNSGPGFSPKSLFQMTLSENPVSFPATLPAQEDDTFVRFGNTYLSGSNLRTNPYAYMATSFNQSKENKINTTIRLDQGLEFITPGLAFEALVNFNAWGSTTYYKSIQPYFFRVDKNSYNPSTPGIFEQERLGTSGTDYIETYGLAKSQDTEFSMRFQLKWDKRIENHSLHAMFMYSQREKLANFDGSKYVEIPSRNQGISGRLTYDYDNRYLAEFNFGYNGTERLDKDNRFEFFPAISLGWVASNEGFFEPVRDVVNHLKFRGSYGLVGSDETGLLVGSPRFLYINTITLGNVGWTSGEDMNTTKHGPYINQYGLVNGGWERAKKLNLALDMQLFNKLNITAEYFQEDRYNILLLREAWPESLGYFTAKPWKNMGKVDNRGVELAVSYNQALTNDLSLEFRGNFTYTKNKYVNLDEPEYPYVWQIQTGQPMSHQYGYIADGLFQSQEEIDNSPVQNLGSTVRVGDIKYRDLNGDGIINDYDRSYISQNGRDPKIQYGFGVTLQYKNFDLGVFFNGSAMRDLMLSGQHPFGQNDYNVFQYIADDYWSVANPNPNAKYPRLALTDADRANNTVNSTFWLRNGNFMRFKSFELGYSFKRGRVYFNGDNLAVFSSFDYYDPELESWSSYPFSRMFNIGIQLNF